MQLDNKVVIVTGAGSGFGRGIADLCAEQGASVVVNDISADGGNQTVSGIEKAGGTAVFKHADVTNRDDIRALVQSTVAEFGKIDIIVNNAGFTHKNKPLLEVSDEEFDKIYDINVRAIFISTQELLPQFRKQGHGNIINTSSTAALRPRPNLAVYNSSKGAVNVLTKSLAVELAPDNIRVNAICPVIGETGLLETFMGVPDTPENRKRFEATIPLGRFSTPRDIAEATVFLAQDNSNYLTGVTLEVDGGRCI